MVTRNQQGDGWTLVLRRQPAWIVDGAPEGGYAADFELICCDCGDDPRPGLPRDPAQASAGPRALHDRGRGRSL